MTPRRSLDARAIWVAVFAAFCVLAFGGSPHSSAAGAAASSTAASTTSYTHSVTSGQHTDSELLTRSVAVSGIALHLAAPSAGLPAFGVGLFLGGWLLLRLRRTPRRRASRLHGPRPARAPPLAA